jgi:hypothetical protein
MEAIPLNDHFSVLHFLSGECNKLSKNLLDQFYALYLLVFKKSQLEIESQVLWHNKAPGTVHYFFGVEKNRLVSFNYFMQFKGSFFSYALSGGSLTHPENRGSFLPLFQFASGLMLRTVDILIGFCNKNSCRVFCHPVLGWKEITDFRQFRLIESLDMEEEKISYTKASIKDIEDCPTYFLPLKRDDLYCSWRLQRVSEPIILINQQSKAISILKPFHHSVDLITIVNITSLKDYVNELKNLHHLFHNQSTTFTGINIYLSFPQIENILTKKFRLESLDHERHLCFKTGTISNTFPNLHIEMIDSDLF